MVNMFQAKRTVSTKALGCSRKAAIRSLFNQYLLRVPYQWLKIQRHSPVLKVLKELRKRIANK